MRTRAMKTVQDDVDMELLPLFIEEADELCPQIGGVLQAWRAQPGDALLERKLLRSLHTLKGSARMAGAMRLGELLHRMEDCIMASRAPRLPAFWAELQENLEQAGCMIEQLRHGAAAETFTETAEEEAVQQAPFASIAKRLYRIVRQAGKELGKKANLELRGTEEMVERSVLEKMTAPFEHLLRNAMAHGLESPAERERAGKPPIGEIRLTLRREPGGMTFEFCDDGAGLDVEGLRRKAVELGLLRPDAAIGDAEVMQLIFAPGLSTAAQVTALAGRGVGMDVVRSEIAALGGRIAVSSAREEGTCFTIHLPFTSASGADRQNCEARSLGLQ